MIPKIEPIIDLHEDVEWSDTRLRKVKNLVLKLKI